MKIGIILETKEGEKAWNAFRFGIAALNNNHEVKLFLMGEAVECEGLIHTIYDIDVQMRKFEAKGGQLMACGTCLKSRQLDDKTACPVSTMNDCVQMVVWADKTLTF